MGRGDAAQALGAEQLGAGAWDERFLCPLQGMPGLGASFSLPPSHAQRIMQYESCMGLSDLPA